MFIYLGYKNKKHTQKESVMTAEEALDHKYDYMDKSEKLINKLRRKITIIGSAELRVLRSLVNAEMANIRAKFYSDTSRDYAMKRRYLGEAIKELPKTGWKFYYQRTYPGIALNYIFSGTPFMSCM